MCILRQLVADERVLCPSRLIEGESHAGVVEGFADEVAALGRDVGVFFAEDLGGSWCVSWGRMVFRVGVFPFLGVGSRVGRTMISSPLMSLTRLRLSSFLPWPRVCEWMSVAK